MNRAQMRRFCCLGAALVAVTPVVAAAAAAGDGADDGAGPVAKLEEITVTAERRSENLQNVPIAISVLSAADAAKLGDVGNMSLTTEVPSFQSSRQITGATLYLRGVGGISGPGNENAVATYVDDVYINGNSGNVVQFNNIDHVEVLKGPQGTLFGRNATAGVINIVTKEPSEKASVDAQVGYGNYRTFDSSLYATGKIADNLTGNIAWESRDQSEGYGRNLTTGHEILLGKEVGVRGKLKWTPGEHTKIILSGGYYWDNYDYGASANVAPGTLSIGNATYAGDYNSQGINGLSPNGEEGHGVHIKDVSLKIDHEFGWATLRSITAARWYNDMTYYDQDMGPLHIVDAAINTYYSQGSEEIHLFSPDDAKLFGHGIHWLAGLFLLRMNDDVAPLGIAGAAAGGLTGFGATSIAYTKSYSAFVDTTYDLTSADSFTVGLRETIDRIKNIGWLQWDDGTGGITYVSGDTRHANYNKMTYRAVFNHRFNDDAMAYVSASRGFKAGGFSLFAENTPPVGPEILDAYALGLKTTWLDERLQADVEAFDYEYKNQQVQVIGTVAPIFINAAQSRINGVDLSLTATPTHALTLRANLGYLHGRYRDFKNAPIFLQNPATCTPTPQRLPGDLVPGGTTCAFDGSGKATIRSPTFSGNIGADYRVTTPVGDFDWAANVFHTSSFSWDPSGQYPEPAYTMLNTSITWTDLTGRFDVRFYCNNCGNRYTNTFIAESAPSIQRGANSPRTFGLRVGAHL